ncbi:hypothetical protein CDV31_013034 [Fusarium ambrosium]|uniref:Aminoglycoside phosphotransferase domain-containing protein n=1 Tax=Fusarium ambrosium TaxID=131363 RepID=A0A428T619_9HYPO|nr:hypothetical protein CDV31_013034 [Fusarium ambrosium]
MVMASRIISMDFSTTGRDDCYFRILTGTSVQYVTIQAGALHADLLMDMPLGFREILPALPYGVSHWNTAFISRNAASGKLEAVLDKKELPFVRTIWHPKKVNFLDLHRTQQLTLLAQECTIKSVDPPEDHEQTTMIAKMARFPWEIQYIESETSIYQLLQSSGIGPRFLGHVQEDGRTIGFLLEKVQGRRAGMADLQVCQRALQRLHDIGVLHGDVNRHNFIINASQDEEAVLVDFEKAVTNADAESLVREMASLEEQLSEQTGRGGGFANAEQ